MITSKKINSSSKLYQGMNFVGAIGLIINGYYYLAYPSAALNFVWAIIAIWGLVVSKNPCTNTKGKF